MKDQISNTDLQSIKEFTQQKMNFDPNPVYIIHDWENTKDLRKKAKGLIKKENVDDVTANVAYTMIYFLNVGYVDRTDKPLNKSASIASDYFSKNGFTERISQEVMEGVKQVKGNAPASFQAATIVQDAYNGYMGEKGIISYIESRYEEYNISREDQVDQVDKVGWLESQIEKMISHRYNCRTARKMWSTRKKSNLSKLKKYVYNLKNDSSLSQNKKALTMFKTSSRNQIDLINIADKKAGIMITVNAILITLMLPLFASYVLDISRFIIPASILLITCGISIILATLATKPAATKEPSRSDFVSGNASLFYFQNFTSLNKEEYKSAIQELIVRDAPFENAVITDLYDLGVLLNVKYKKLRWCYWIFAIGNGAYFIDISHFGDNINIEIR